MMTYKWDPGRRIIMTEMLVEEKMVLNVLKMFKLTSSRFQKHQEIEGYIPKNTLRNMIF